ncbi:MAG: hypothetical protein QFX35_00800 [Candidatus Verstraetearchaeota archaeon]|nr:hypothetical protein [Candidatus Verstraetearchaeota archaeon]
MADGMWKILSAAFLIWAIGASVGLAYYYQTSQNQQKLLDNYAALADELANKVNICIDYGNGTTVWRNNTLVRVGLPLLNVTMKVAEVNYTVHAGMGVWVHAINGVYESSTANKWWVYTVWNEDTDTWDTIWESADQYIPSNGESIKWELKQF